MKKLMVLFFVIGIAGCASAQVYGHGSYDDRGPSVTVGIGDGRFSMERRIDEINREFDHKIWEVRNDPRLSPHEKRKFIRHLNREREDRIRDIRRHNRRY